MRFRHPLLYLLLLGNVFSQAPPEADDVYKKLSLTFKYGTKGEVTSALGLYNSQNINSSNKSKYMAILEELLETVTLDYDLNYAIYRIILEDEFFKRSYFQKVFDKIMEKSSIVGNDLRLYGMTLDLMIDSKDKEFLKNFEKIYQDEGKLISDKGGRTQEIFAKVIRGYRFLGGVLDHDELKKIYNDQEYPEVREEVIRTITANQVPVDIDFLKEKLEDTATDKTVRWLILVGLGEYKDDTRVKEILEGYSTDKDETIKARALYALSKLGGKDDKMKIFKDSIRSDSADLRLQALDIVEDIMSDEIKSLLRYKADRDTSKAVRDKAKKILEKVDPSSKK